MVNSLGTWFRRQSVGRKLTTTALTTSGVTLMAACTVFGTYDYLNSRSRLVRDVAMLADIVGTNSTAALTFKDATAAADTLRATAVNEHILNARLFTRDGTLLATYMRPGVSLSPALPDEAKRPGVEAVARFEESRLRVVRPISLNHEIIGSIAVESDTTEVWSRLARFAAIVAGTLFGAFWIALGLSRTTARLIFGPIARLIEVTRLVRDGGHYDVRADAGDDDEIGELTDQFNAMLSDIQKRDQQLLLQQDNLERTVDARTAELQTSNEELVEARDRAMEASRAKSESKPSAAAPPAVKSRADALAMGADGRRARILVVEDNVVNQQVACGLLTHRGHHVTVAQDGREALARLDRETFDLVLMDLQMPVMGGLDATVAIRLRERVTGQHVRIVAMTAHAMNGDRERCLAAGMDGYLSKPIDPPMLFAAVELDGDGGGGIQTAVAQPATFDEDALRHRLSGDHELMTDVIHLFLEDLPVRLAAIGDAVTGRNAEALCAAAHALKGAAGNLSAGGLFEAARVLERIGAESHMDAAEAAWRQLSVEASNIIDVLRRHSPSAKEP